MSFRAWFKAHYDEKGSIRWVAFFLELISASVLFFMMILTCIDVVGRYLFNKPLHGSTEMTEVSLAVIVFAVMPVITWRGGHVVVDLIDRFMTSIFVKLLAIFAAVSVSFSLYFLANRIFELGNRSIRRGEMTEFLSIPSGYIMQFIAIMSWGTALFMITYGVYRILIKK